MNTFLININGVTTPLTAYGIAHALPDIENRYAQAHALGVAQFTMDTTDELIAFGEVFRAFRKRHSLAYIDGCLDYLTDRYMVVTPEMVRAILSRKNHLFCTSRERAVKEFAQHYSDPDYTSPEGQDRGSGLYMPTHPIIPCDSGYRIII